MNSVDEELWARAAGLDWRRQSPRERVGKCPYCGCVIGTYGLTRQGGLILLKPGYTEDARGIWRRTETKSRRWGRRGRDGHARIAPDGTIGIDFGSSNPTVTVQIDPFERARLVCPGRGPGPDTCGARLRLRHPPVDG